MTDMLGSTVGLLDVEVQHFLSSPKLRVQSDRRLVFIVRLDEDNIGAFGFGNPLNFADQGCSDALPAEVFINRQIVDVGLRAGLLELGQDVGSQSANYLVPREGRNRNEVRLRQQGGKVGVIRLLRGVRGDVFEGYSATSTAWFRSSSSRTRAMASGEVDTVLMRALTSAV